LGLPDSQKGPNGKHLYQCADAGINALENAIVGLQESQQAKKIWDWVQTMEKDNPSFVKAIVKTYLDGTCQSCTHLTVPAS
jgi:hypothetical protein